MRQLLAMAVLLAACVVHAADGPHVDPRAQMGAYLFDDGIRVSGGRFDESGSQMLLYTDTATSRRGSTLKPDGDGYVPAFNFGDVERVTFSDGDNRMQWQMPSGEVREARRVMRPQFRDVQFDNGDVTLRGTLYLPPDAVTPVPAVVLAHGSGPATRHLGTWTTFFLEQGLAVLSYDKRGAGESTGDWQASSYLELAADLSRAVDHIRKLPMIDADRVGIHSSSQSGWYGPHVARNNPGVAFLIQRVGPAVNIGIGTAHEIREEWRAEGLPEEHIQAGVEFWLELHRLAAEEAALTQANTLFDDAKKEPWFAQTFGEWKPIESAWWQRLVANMQLEPAEDVAQLDIPVLWFLAEKDQNVPYAASHAALQKAKDANTQLELITVQDSPHSFLLPAANDKLRYTRNYWPVMSAWLRDRGFVDAPPQIFRFTTDRFWLNLHHFLYVLGRAQAGMPDIDRRAVAQAPGDEEQGLAELSPEEQALWREAVAIYAEGPSQLDMVFDEKLLKTTHGVKDAVAAGNPTVRSP